MNRNFSYKAAASLLAFGVLFYGALPTCTAQQLPHTTSHRLGTTHRTVRWQAKPVYPELAKRMDIKGTVWVEATIAPNGDVVAAKAVHGNSLLASAAEEAVRKWKFAAAHAQTREKVEIEFDLTNYGNLGAESRTNSFLLNTAQTRFRSGPHTPAR